MEVHVTSNIDQFTRHLKEHRKQVPYAVSRAINDVLKKIRIQIIADVKRQQRGGKQWWNNRVSGIRLGFSSKRNLVGSVGTDMYWAELQNEGGIKRPRGKTIAIPQASTPKTYRRSGGVAKALGTKGVFINSFGVFRRKSKAKGAGRWAGTELLFRFKDQAVIKKETGVLKNFFTIANRVNKRGFESALAKWLEQAIKNAR